MAGSERGSPAKECDISEAAATSGEGAEGAQLTRGCAGQDRQGGDATAPALGWLSERLDSHGTLTQASGRAGAEALGGLGVAAEHGVWVPHCIRHSVSGGLVSSNPSTRLKIDPCLPTALRPSGLQPAGGRHRTGRHLDREATSAPAPLAGTQHPQAAGVKRGRGGVRYRWLGVVGVVGVGRGAADHAPSAGTQQHE